MTTCRHLDLKNLQNTVHHVLDIDRCLRAEFSFSCFSFFLLDRYYDDDMNDCFPCVKCCQDEKDVVENECKEKLGTGSNMICSHSSINRCDKSTPPPTAQPSHASQTKTTKHRDVLIAVSIFVPLCIIIIIIAVCLYIHKARLAGCYSWCYSWCNCNTETSVVEIGTAAYSTCMVHCEPTEETLGRTAMFY